ncbi:hypothetical protein DIPPA_02257 [Diplonema papillatum]|nr:hypothetical protein DIPPA_02257 [Diplonema papillatum]
MAAELSLLLSKEAGGGGDGARAALLGAVRATRDAVRWGSDGGAVWAELRDVFVEGVLASLAPPAAVQGAVFAALAAQTRPAASEPSARDRAAGQPDDRRDLGNARNRRRAHGEDIFVDAAVGPAASEPGVRDRASGQPNDRRDLGNARTRRAHGEDIFVDAAVGSAASEPGVRDWASGQPDDRRDLGNARNRRAHGEDIFVNAAVRGATFAARPGPAASEPGGRDRASGQPDDRQDLGNGRKPRCARGEEGAGRSIRAENTRPNVLRELLSELCTHPDWRPAASRSLLAVDPVLAKAFFAYSWAKAAGPGDALPGAFDGHRVKSGPEATVAGPEGQSGCIQGPTASGRRGESDPEATFAAPGGREASGREGTQGPTAGRPRGECDAEATVAAPGCDVRSKGTGGTQGPTGSTPPRGKAATVAAPGGPEASGHEGTEGPTASGPRRKADPEATVAAPGGTGSSGHEDTEGPTASGPRGKADSEATVAAPVGLEASGREGTQDPRPRVEGDAAAAAEDFPPGFAELCGRVFPSAALDFSKPNCVGASPCTGALQRYLMARRDVLWGRVAWQPGSPGHPPVVVVKREHLWAEADMPRTAALFLAGHCLSPSGAAAAAVGDGLFASPAWLAATADGSLLAFDPSFFARAAAARMRSGADDAFQLALEVLGTERGEDSAQESSVLNSVPPDEGGPRAGRKKSAQLDPGQASGSEEKPASEAQPPVRAASGSEDAPTPRAPNRFRHACNDLVQRFVLETPWPALVRCTVLKNGWRNDAIARLMEQLAKQWNQAGHEEPDSAAPAAAAAPSGALCRRQHLWRWLACNTVWPSFPELVWAAAAVHQPVRMARIAEGLMGNPSPAPSHHDPTVPTVAGSASFKRMLEGIASGKVPRKATSSKGTPGSHPEATRRNQPETSEAVTMLAVLLTRTVLKLLQSSPAQCQRLLAQEGWTAVPVPHPADPPLPIGSELQKRGRARDSAEKRGKRRKLGENSPPLAGSDSGVELSGDSEDPMREWIARERKKKKDKKEKKGKKEKKRKTHCGHRRRAGSDSGSELSGASEGPMRSRAARDTKTAKKVEKPIHRAERSGVSEDRMRADVACDSKKSKTQQKEEASSCLASQRLGAGGSLGSDDAAGSVSCWDLAPPGQPVTRVSSFDFLPFVADAFLDLWIPLIAPAPH